MIVRNIKVIDELMRSGLIVTENPGIVRDVIDRYMKTDDRHGLLAVLRALEGKPGVEVSPIAYDQVRSGYGNS